MKNWDGQLDFTNGSSNQISFPCLFFPSRELIVLPPPPPPQVPPVEVNACRGPRPSKTTITPPCVSYHCQIGQVGPLRGCGPCPEGKAHPPADGSIRNLAWSLGLYSSLPCGKIYVAAAPPAINKFNKMGGDRRKSAPSWCFFLSPRFCIFLTCWLHFIRSTIDSWQISFFFFLFSFSWAVKKKKRLNRTYFTQNNKSVQHRQWLEIEGRASFT